MHLGIDQLVDGDLPAFGGQRIDIDGDRLELAPEHAAGRIDLLECQGRAVEIVLVVGDTGLCGLRRRHADLDRIG